MSKNNASYEAVEKVVDNVDSVVVSDKEREMIKFSKLIVYSFVKKNEDFLENFLLKTCEIFNDFTKMKYFEEKKKRLSEVIKIIKLKRKIEIISWNEVVEIIKNGHIDSELLVNDVVDVLTDIIEMKKESIEKMISEEDENIEDDYKKLYIDMITRLDNTNRILNDSKWFIRKMIDSPIYKALMEPFNESVKKAWNKKDPTEIISIPEMYGIDMNDIINLIKQIKTIAENEK